MPPALELLKPKEQEELIKSAKAGNQEALETLVERIFWGASPLCLSIEDILKINNINNKILGDLGYYYWYLITMRNAFDTFPNVANIIKILAKNSNFAPAQYIYGLMHQFGYGVSRWNTKDFTKAFKYYKKATAQQFVPAQHAMGLAYSKGIGVEEIRK
jgi:TPR repeat protein